MAVLLPRPAPQVSWAAISSKWRRQEGRQGYRYAGCHRRPCYASDARATHEPLPTPAICISSAGLNAGGLLFGRKDDAVVEFQQEGFDTTDFISNHFPALSEKEIDSARHELTALNEFCKQEVRTAPCNGADHPEAEAGQGLEELCHAHMHNAHHRRRTSQRNTQVQKVVHSHHKQFLEASRSIHDVELLVDELRTYVSAGAAVVANLKEMQPMSKQVRRVAAVTGGGGGNRMHVYQRAHTCIARGRMERETGHGACMHASCLDAPLSHACDHAHMQLRLQQGKRRYGMHGGAKACKPCHASRRSRPPRTCHQR